jgi:hypothetical protein
MLKRLLLSLFLLGGLSRPSQAVLAASDLVSRVRTLLKDASTSANRQQFTDTQYLQWASDGQREANALNWLLQSSFSFVLQNSVQEYSVPTDFMFPNRVWANVPASQPWQKIPASSQNDLDARYPGWQTVTGGPPIAYFMDMSSNTVLLGFYPIPTIPSTGTVIVYYVQNPVDLLASNESAIPFNGWLVLQPYVSALPYYMAYRAYLTLEETDLAQVYYKEWLNFLMVMRQGLNRQPDFNPAAGALRSGSPSSQGGLGGP